jgi:hypothetical protein
LICLFVDCLGLDDVDVDVSITLLSSVFYLIFLVRLRARGGEFVTQKGKRSDWSQKRREDSIQGIRLQMPGLLEIKTEQRTAFGHSSVDLRKLDQEYLTPSGWILIVKIGRLKHGGSFDA